jgi:hypothetical protein
LLYEPYATLKREIEQNDYYFFMGEYVENKTHVFLVLANHYTGNYAYIFGDKESLQTLGGTGLITSFSTRTIPITSKDDYFVSYYLPYKVLTDKKNLFDSTLVSENDKIKLRNIKEDDNPVLMFYELKSF